MMITTSCCFIYISATISVISCTILIYTNHVHIISTPIFKQKLLCSEYDILKFDILQIQNSRPNLGINLLFRIYLLEASHRSFSYHIWMGTGTKYNPFSEVLQEHLIFCQFKWNISLNIQANIL